MSKYVPAGRVAAVACVAAGLIAGCGGSSSSGGNQTAQFKTQFSSVTAQFKTTSQAIGKAIESANGKSDAAILTEFKGLATQWQSDVSKLQTLKAPSAEATQFNTMTSAASRAAADLQSIVSAAETHSSSSAEQASASLVSDISAAKSAAQSIDQKLG